MTEQPQGLGSKKDLVLLPRKESSFRSMKADPGEMCVHVSEWCGGKGGPPRTGKHQ